MGGLHMERINKHAILISWPRELDMFSMFINNILDDVIIIVDDFIYTDDKKFENGKNIIKLLDGKIEYALLSEVLGRVKYRTLFSTGGQTFQNKITYGSYFKYLYAIYVGSFVELFRLSKFFLRVIGRPLTGGGKHADKFKKYPIEKLLGFKVIKYPKGLDINKLIYPEDKWRGVFDMYLCHSYIDQNLISNKFPESECVKIGYPRYDNLPSTINAKKIIYNEIKDIEVEKPLLLWIPTFNRIQDEVVDNIRVWAPILKNLLGKYNILVRIHPKLAVIDSEIDLYLTDAGFLKDVKKGRNLGILYQSSDLVLADYGGPVLSTIYTKKKLILLNSPNKKFIRWRKERMYIDDEVRNDVDNFNINNGVSLIKKVNINIENNDLLKRDKIKEKYFGKDCDYRFLKEVFYELLQELHT
jgi:hypothetical protein